MSDLSYMEKLLDGADVEWKALEDVFDILAGGDVPKGALSDIETEEFNIPILSNGIGDRSLYGWTNKAKVVRPSITISARGTIGWTSYRDKPIFPIVRLLVLTSKIELNLKYAYHYMKAIENNYNVPKNGIPQLTKPMVKDIVIPIPPLNVQAEIVRILDAFTELNAELNTELNAELVARKQQYACYQEELLTFEDNMECEELKEIAVFSQGIQVDTSKQFSEKPDSFVRFLRIVDFVKDNEPPRYIENHGERYVKNEGDLVMIRYGARAAGKVFLKYSGAIANNMFQIKLTTPKITIAYLHCYLSQQKIYNFLNSNGGNSTMPAITFSQIGAIKIPIPTLSEQERIVTIFNKLDALSTSLTEGLPREIALRQQQYEYYRELLLSFPKLEGEA